MTLFKKVKELSRDQSGSVALFLLFSFAVVFGSMALALDAVRYYTLQSRMENIAQASAILASGNRVVLSEDTLENFSRQVAKLELEGSPIPSFQSAAVQLKSFTVNRSEDGTDTSVTLSAALPTTFMKAIGFLDNIEIVSVATARSEIENTEIVFVLDRSLIAGSSGKLAPIIEAARIFSSLVDTLKSKSEGAVKIGVVPFGNRFTNVSPYKQWVPVSDWPTQIPPNVPGVTEWNGLLEDQRWCVEPRTDEIEKGAPPATEKFPLVLEVRKTPGAAPKNDRYFIATPQDCASTPIKPLQSEIVGLDAYFSSLSAHGLTANGTAMVWAERMLSPNWSGAWEGESGSPAAYGTLYKKVVVMFSASANRGGLGEEQKFADSCGRMKANGITTYIVNFGSPAAASNGLVACASTSGHYFSVSDETGLIRAMKDIVKSLFTVRIIAFN